MNEITDSDYHVHLNIKSINGPDDALIPIEINTEEEVSVIKF